MWQRNDRADPVLRSSSAVVVAVVDVQHCLDLIVSGRNRRKGRWRRDVFGVGIDVNRSAGTETLNLSCSDPRGGGGKLDRVDGFVSRTGLQKNEQTAADRPGDA